MKTSELTGAALDWAVDKAQGKFCLYPHASYSTDWAQGGPIIEREKISLLACDNDWEAQSRTVPLKALEGPTALIAACRCYVASKLGDEVDVPEELA